MTASQNVLSGKGPTRIIEAKSGPAQDLPQDSHHEPESSVQNSLELSQAGAVTTSLGPCSSADWPLGKELFSNTQPNYTR